MNIQKDNGEGVAPTEDHAAEVALEAASQQHFYWFTQALEALEEMRRLAFDTSKQSTEEFAAARARFNEARSRCKVEFEVLNQAVGVRVLKVTAAPAEKKEARQ